MYIAKSLLEAICLTHEDSYWTQPIDYENVPFQCLKCHEHGHLYRYFPLNKAHKENMKDEEKDAKGFQKIGKKRCNNGKLAPKKNHGDAPTTRNRFFATDNQPEIPETDSKMGNPNQNFMLQDPQKQ